jgi:hypothetical protein
VSSYRGFSPDVDNHDNNHDNGTNHIVDNQEDKEEEKGQVAFVSGIHQNCSTLLRGNCLTS